MTCWFHFNLFFLVIVAADTFCVVWWFVYNFRVCFILVFNHLYLQAYLFVISSLFFANWTFSRQHNSFSLWLFSPPTPCFRVSISQMKTGSQTVSIYAFFKLLYVLNMVFNFIGFPLLFVLVRLRARLLYVVVVAWFDCYFYENFHEIKNVCTSINTEQNKVPWSTSRRLRIVHLPPWFHWNPFVCKHSIEPIWSE